METLKPHKSSEKREFGTAKELFRATRKMPPQIEYGILRNITVSTIIFDLSEVQITGLKGVEHRLEPILKTKASHIVSMLTGDDLNDFFHGRISEEEYLSRLISKNDWKIDIEFLKRLIRNNFTEIEGTRKILERLKKQGFKLGLLSVHGKEWIEYSSKKFDFHKLFDEVLYSFEVGVSKPDKRAYEIILDKLGSKPEECLFIDDSSKSLIPAKELGMKTVLFENAKQLEKELSGMGILKD